LSRDILSRDILSIDNYIGQMSVLIVFVCLIDKFVDSN